MDMTTIAARETEIRATVADLQTQIDAGLQQVDKLRQRREQATAPATKVASLRASLMAKISAAVRSGSAADPGKEQDEIDRLAAEARRRELEVQVIDAEIQRHDGEIAQMKAQATAAESELPDLAYARAKLLAIAADADLRQALDAVHAKYMVMLSAGAQAEQAGKLTTSGKAHVQLGSEFQQVTKLRGLLNLGTSDLLLQLTDKQPRLG